MSELYRIEWARRNRRGKERHYSRDIRLEEEELEALLQLPEIVFVKLVLAMIEKWPAGCEMTGVYLVTGDKHRKALPHAPGKTCVEDWIGKRNV